MRKFAIFLLFQFRIIKDGKSSKKRICEERIYNINVKNANKAYLKAKKIGSKEEFAYKDGDKKVRFEFIGIVDIVELLKIDDENLTWSRFVEKIMPMEQRKKILPKKINLQYLT